MSATILTPRRKEKDKCKVNSHDDAIHELTGTIKGAFGSVRSSRLVSYTKELQDECVRLTQYGYSTKQVVMMYKHLMANDA